MERLQSGRRLARAMAYNCTVIHCQSRYGRWNAEFYSTYPWFWSDFFPLASTAIPNDGSCTSNASIHYMLLRDFQAPSTIHCCPPLSVELHNHHISSHCLNFSLSLPNKMLSEISHVLPLLLLVSSHSVHLLCAIQALQDAIPHPYHCTRLGRLQCQDPNINHHNH